MFRNANSLNSFFISLFSILACDCTLYASAQAASPTNVIYSATNYSGADASVKINACIAAVIAAGGGVCDASGLGGTQTMSQQINLGSTASVSNRIGVTLLLPDSARWFWRLTDVTSCGIYQYGSTTIRGNQPAGGGNRMILEASSGADMDSIYCTAASSTGNYVRAEGFAIENNQPGSTFANGIVHIRDVVDQARFSEMFAGNIYGDVWHVESACCGASFENIQGASYSGGNAGGIPLTVGPGKVRSVAFYNSTFNSPGSGQPDIKILGDPPTNVMGVDFYNTYMEGNGAYDNTTAMIYIGQYVGPVHFFGGLANTEQTSLTNTKAIFENHGLYLDVPAFEVVNSTLAIDDVTAGTKTAVWDYNHNLGMTPPYSTKH